MTKALESELRAAQAHLRAAYGGDSAMIAAAFDRLHAAQRALAASRGEPYAVPLDLGAEWDIGAPLPHLISGRRTFILCHAQDHDPAWDSSYVTVVSPGDLQPSPLLVIEVEGCNDIRIGGPNDEALNGHPLWGKGLGAYGAYEVRNSAWIEHVIKVNSVHPQHRDEPFRRLRHYVLLLHDEMVEALGSALRVSKRYGSIREILVEIAEGLTA